jgi:hypothetical protein
MTLVITSCHTCETILGHGCQYKNVMISKTHVKTEAISYHNVTLNVSILRCHGNDNNNVSGC